MRWPAGAPRWTSVAALGQWYPWRRWPAAHYAVSQHSIPPSLRGVSAKHVVRRLLSAVSARRKELAGGPRRRPCRGAHAAPTMSDLIPGRADQAGQKCCAGSGRCDYGVRHPWRRTSRCTDRTNIAYGRPKRIIGCYAEAAAVVVRFWWQSGPSTRPAPALSIARHAHWPTRRSFTNQKIPRFTAKGPVDIQSIHLRDGGPNAPQAPAQHLASATSRKLSTTG